MLSRKSLFAFPSRSSSVYSEDEVSNTNSTGTQIHHPSKIQATINDGEQSQYSDQSLLAKNSPEGSNVGAPERPEVQYPSETPEGIDERHQHAADLARAGTTTDTWRQLSEDASNNYRQKVLARGNAWNHTQPPLERPLQDDHGSPLDFNPGVIGPRPPTPPRRRPRTTSTGSISLQSYHTTLGSISSVAAASLMNDRGNTNTSSDRPEPSMVNKRDVPQSSVNLQNLSPTIDRSSRGPTEDKQLTLRRRENRAKTLEALSGRKLGTPFPPLTSNPGDEGSDIFREGSLVVRHQCRTDWRDDMMEDPDASERAGMVSGTGRIYDRGHYSAGYLNGNFVTNLQRDLPPPEEQKKRKAKRLFCF